MIEHTPTPWRAMIHFPEVIVPASHADRSLGGSIYEAEDRDRFALVIARAERNRFSNFAHELSEEQTKANAAFIVKAVNAHDAMLFALQLVREAVWDDGTQRLTFAKLWSLRAEVVEEAIAKATGEPRPAPSADASKTAEASSPPPDR